TAWPFTLRPRPVIGARLEARTWMLADWPGVTGKLGVRSTVTAGGVGFSEARRTLPVLADRRPSLTVHVTTYWPDCPGPGVHTNRPVAGSSAAPAGRSAAL